MHILNNRQEYGTQERIMALIKTCTKGKLMNCWESMYIQEYHRKGHLITEQQTPEHNLHFDQIITTLATKDTTRASIGDDKHKTDSIGIT